MPDSSIASGGANVVVPAAAFRTRPNVAMRAAVYAPGGTPGLEPLVDAAERGSD